MTASDAAANLARHMVLSWRGCSRPRELASARSSVQRAWGELRAIESSTAICHGPRGRHRVMADTQLLAGRVAVVTGAAYGMGRVTARARAAAGDKSAVVDIDRAVLGRRAEEAIFPGEFLNAVA